MNCSRRLGRAGMGLAAVLAAAGAPVVAQPVFVVTNRTTMYRAVNGVVGTSSIAPERLSKMAIVPPDVSIPGFAPGDVMSVGAVENGDGSVNVYRIGGVCAGAPVLELVRTGAILAGDIAFANGRLYGIDSVGGVTRLTEFDLDTFEPLGEPVALANVTGAGGLAFDGEYFYFSAGGPNRLFRYSEATGTERLNPPEPIEFTNSDLEWFGGRLWGAIAQGNTDIQLGVWDRTNGQFTALYTLDRVADPDAIGIGAVDCGCAADFNGDGTVNTQDVIRFLNAWTAGQVSADFNGDGAIDTRDVIGFLGVWAAGC